MNTRALVLLPLLLAAVASGQPRSQITGVIRDLSDAVLVDAGLTVTNLDSGIRRSSRSDGEGAYAVASLPPGAYKITVRKEGFQTLARLNIHLAPGQNARIDFAMQVGSMRQVITISDDPPLVNADDGSVGVHLERDLVDRLPLNGRGVLSLLDLAPGVLSTPATGGEAGQFSTNGQRPNMNYFTVDGVSANSSVSGGALPAQFAGGGLPAMTAFGSTQNLVTTDDLEEVRIQTSSFAPEFGRLPGAHVGLSTRAGSNELHGSLFYILRNEKLNAADWFSNRYGLDAAASRLNNWGGSLGGPVRRDRTFFFASYEGLRLTQPFTWVEAVPSAAARESAPRFVRGLLDAYPVPNGADVAPGVGLFTASGSRPAQLDSGSLRIDHSLTTRHTLFARYNQAPSSTAFGATQVSQSEYQSRSLTAGLTSLLPGQVTNDLRVNTSSAKVGSNWTWTGLGGAVQPDFRAIFASAGAPSGATVLYGFGIANLGNVIAGDTGKSRQDQWNLVETLAIHRGAHAVRLGIDYNRLEPARDGVVVSVAGWYQSLSGALAGNSMTVTDAQAGRASSRITTFSAFVQDTWQVNPRLVLTWGSRWEFTPAPPNQVMPVATTVPPLSATSIFPSAPPAGKIWPTRFTQFAPRIGAAYRISPHSVLRAGWGIFYDLSFSIATDPINGVPFNRWQFSAAPAAPVSAAAAASGYGYAPNLRLPYTMEWNAAYEHALTAADVVSLSYVGSSGHDLLRRESAAMFGGQAAGEVLATNHGSSNFNSLEIQYRRRMARGLEGLLSYTWAHSLDNGSYDSGLYLTQAGVKPSRDWASSSFDVRSSFTAALSWDLPRVPIGLLRGWAADGILRVRSGFPVDVLVNPNVLGIGFDNVTRPDLVPGQTVWIADASAPHGRRLNPHAFAVPSGQQGDLGRNAISGFGFSEIDLALRRDFRLRNESSMQVRMEAFNVANHPGFGDPARFLTNPLFGQSVSMLNSMLGAGSPHSGLTPSFQIGGPRVLQFSLRFRF